MDDTRPPLFDEKWSAEPCDHSAESVIAAMRRLGIGVDESIDPGVEIAHAMVRHGLSNEGRRFLEAVEASGPEWDKVRDAVAHVVARADVDQHRLAAYTFTLLGYGLMGQQLGWDSPDVRVIAFVLDLFFLRYLRHLTNVSRQATFPESSGPIKTYADYAPGITDLKARVLAGAAVRPVLSGEQFQAWLLDASEFRARLERHEYPRSDAEEMARALDGVIAASKGEQAILDGEIDSIRRSATFYLSGPAHLVALEAQWKCYRLAVRHQTVADRLSQLQGEHAQQWLRTRGAMQNLTADTLKIADTYCWSSTPVQAVAAAADTFTPDVSLSTLALGDLAFPGKAGWWWFTDGIPVQTTTDARKGVVALLWARLFEPKPHLWFSCQTLDVEELNGRQQIVPVPSLAWCWDDGYSLEKLETVLREAYGRAALTGDKVDGREVQLRGLDSPDADISVSAALWFSRFFLSAAGWLRQRVGAPPMLNATPGQGVRQVARNIQREHKLSETPRVRVVDLRRREVVSRTVDDAPDDERQRRQLTCRFVVHGFWRNQWYPSQQTHAPKWIDAYEKGPADKPLRVSPRVFAVRR